MFYVSDSHAVYQTNSRDIAEMIGPNPEEMGSNVLHIDFGGILIAGMERINIAVNGMEYSILAHHLSRLAGELTEALAAEPAPYVTIEGYPFNYALGRADAEALMHNISQNWNEYRALELHNHQRYRAAMEALSGSPGVDVRRELANLPVPEVN